MILIIAIDDNLWNDKYATISQLAFKLMTKPEFMSELILHPKGATHPQDPF